MSIFQGINKGNRRFPLKSYVSDVEGYNVPSEETNDPTCHEPKNPAWVTTSIRVGTLSEGFFVSCDVRMSLLFPDDRNKTMIAGKNKCLNHTSYTKNG